MACQHNWYLLHSTCTPVSTYAPAVPSRFHNHLHPHNLAMAPWFFYSLWWCSHISKVAALHAAVFHNFQNHTTSDHDWHILLQVLSTRTTISQIVFYSLSSLFLLSYSKRCRHGQQQAQLVQHSLNCVSHESGGVYMDQSSLRWVHKRMGAYLVLQESTKTL